MNEPADTPPSDRPKARAERLAKPLANHYRRWRRRFARRRNAIQTRTGSEPLDFKSVHSHWIVGRDLCLYRAEDFAAIPKNRRDAAVALRIPVWSPFERTAHHCIWSGSTAMVWFWDQDAVDIRPADLGLADPETETTGPEGPAAHVRILPESVFQPRHGTGLRLQACASGFDLQYWHGEILLDSLWLPEAPDAARIRAFTSPANLAPDTPVDAVATPIPQEPEPSPASFSPDPWYSPLTPRPG